MGPFPAFKHRFSCHPQFHGSGNRGSESSSGVQGHTRETVELGHELVPGCETPGPRPCGKQWSPQGRLVERRRREARGSGRLPGGGGRGQAAQSRGRITTGVCPGRALGDYERGSPRAWAQPTLGQGRLPGFMCSCMRRASAKAVQELPATFTHASSPSLRSKSWGLWLIFPEWKRDVTWLIPGHVASLQKNPGPEAPALSLGHLWTLVWGWGAHLRSPCWDGWAGAWGHLPGAGPGASCGWAPCWAPRDRSRRGWARDPSWHGSQGQLQGKQDRSTGRPGHSFLPRPCVPGTSTHVGAEHGVRGCWLGVAERWVKRLGLVIRRMLREARAPASCWLIMWQALYMQAPAHTTQETGTSNSPSYR